MGLREQRSEDNPSHPRQVAQDCRVALLGILPRLGLRSGKLFDQAVDPPRDGLDLAIDQVEALRHGRDVSAGSICKLSCPLQRLDTRRMPPPSPKCLYLDDFGCPCHAHLQRTPLPIRFVRHPT